jgi:hypothetical protein
MSTATRTGSNTIMDKAFLAVGTSVLLSTAALGVASSLAKDRRRARAALTLLAGFGAGYVRSRFEIAVFGRVVDPRNEVTAAAVHHAVAAVVQAQRLGRPVSVARRRGVHRASGRGRYSW